MQMPIIPKLLAVALFVAGAVVPGSAPGGENPAVPEEVATILGKYCGDCHEGDDAEASVRFEGMAALSAAGRLDLLNKTEAQLFFGLMPPADEGQPAAEERRALLAWVQGELRRHGASVLDAKRRSPEAGNWVDHDTLFRGSGETVAFTPARRWLVSPQIFLQRVYDVFDLPQRARDAARHGLHGLTVPMALPEHSGVRDYDGTSLNGGHLVTMLANAEWISRKQIRSARVKAGEIAADEFENKSDRFSPPTPAAFEAVILKKSPPDDAEMDAAIAMQFARVLRRDPRPDEGVAYRKLMADAVEIAGNTEGLRQMLQAVLLDSEFLYRSEFGEGEPDESGRRLLSPREAAFAIAYAIGDRGPDEALMAAALGGRLKSREDYEREVRRMLADQQYHRGWIDPVLSIEHAAEYYAVPHPKIVRFFREFFGYPAAVRVFKDGQRSDGIYRVPDRGTFGTPGFLVVEADRIVARAVAEDRSVFETLLTTDQYFLYHDQSNGKGAALIEGWRQVYETLKGTDWRKDPEAVAAEHQDLLRKFVVPGGMKGKGNGRHESDVVRIMNLFEDTFGRGGTPFTTFPWAHGNRLWHAPIYNLPRTPTEGNYGKDEPFDYHPVQPFTMPHRRGILSHPAWLIAHSANTATDPVRRGKWIREKLLAGSVPDVPITVDAKIPDDPHLTLGDRLRKVTSKQECWKCHVRMNPLGLPFEIFDDFGRFRTVERLEHPDNVISEAGSKQEGTVYRTAPFSSAGTITGTGEPGVDGDVKDAFELIERLGRSVRVRQSMIRYAFRFYLGRNEMPGDAATLRAAERAYGESGGSFKAVIVSLLTSDSFLYRRGAER